jgi:hypothetical protein
MSYNVNSLRREKITFTLIISILLFSLIYISSSTIVLRNENLKFKNTVDNTRKEIDLLLTVDIPSKDSAIAEQKLYILNQSKIIEEELAKGKHSEDEKRILRAKLDSLKVQANELRVAISRLEKEQIEETRRMISMSESKKDSMLEIYKNQVAVLQKKIKSLESENRSTPQTVLTTKTIIKEKLSTFYFSARPSDRKNRASRTDFVIMQLQLKGDMTTVRCRWLQVEIRDPNNTIITDQRDRIEGSSDHRTEYMFMPEVPRKTFIKGKYSIRVFCQGSDYEHVEFFSLI